MLMKCKKCSSKFYHKSSLARHQKLHSEEKSFSCTVCNKAYHTKLELNKHGEYGHPSSGRVTKYECDKCSAVFSLKYSHVRHMKVHNTEKEFLCEMCPQAFHFTSDLKRHLQSHRQEKPYRCTVCSNVYARQHTLTVHKKKHHGNASMTETDNKPTFTCRMCPKKYSSRISCFRHERTHTGESPYFCKLCSKSFTRKGHLDIHLRTHTGEKPFKCEICTRAFSASIQLKVHLRNHLGGKPLACAVCSKAFNYKSELERHMKVHGLKSSSNPSPLQYVQNKLSSSSSIDTEI